MFFGKPKVVVQDDRFNYFEDGKIEENKRLFGNYLLIKVFKNNEEGYSCKDKKPPTGFKYIISFKTSDGTIKYCFTNTLNTSFLRLAIEVLKGKGKNYLLKISPKLAILFFEKDVYILYGDSEKEIEEKAKSILQGFDYEVITFDEVLKLIKPKKKLSPYVIVLALLILVIGGYYTYDYFLGEEETPQMANANKILPPPVPVQQHKQPKEAGSLPYEKTVYFIDLIKSAKLPLYNIFVSDIDFDSKSIKLGSFVPLPNFQKENDFYVYPVVLSQKIENDLEKWHTNMQNYKLSTVINNYAKCLSYLNRFPLEAMGDNYLTYSVEAIWNIDKTAQFLNKMSVCPVEIKGEIRFADLMHRVVSLKIKLFTPASLAIKH